MADSFRMDLTGDNGFRERALERAGETFNEATRSKAVTLACEHGRLDAKAKAETLEYLAGELDLETLAETAELLSTRTMPIELDATIEPGPDGLETRVDVDVGRRD